MKIFNLISAPCRNSLFTAVAGLAMLAVSVTAAFAVSGQGYWQDSRSTTCSNAAVCILNFSPTPAGKTVILTNIGCQITTTTGHGPIQAAVLGSKSGAGFDRAIATYLKPVRTADSFSLSYFSISDTVVHILLPGDKGFIRLDYAITPDNSIVKCSVGGLIKP